MQIITWKHIPDAGQEKCFCEASLMKKIMIFANNDVGLFKFRKELIAALLDRYQVHIALPYGDYVDSLVQMGCIFHATEFQRRGKNPINDFILLNKYNDLLREVSPMAVLTYTVKPNIYGGIICTLRKVPYIANITGLGTAIENGGLMQKLLLALYKLGLRKAQKVFFQNEANRDFMLSKGVVKGAFELLPGSGVNLDEHSAEPYPNQEKPLVFVTIGRIMKDKGADEILYAAKTIQRDYPNVVFRLIGGFDGAYEEKVQQAVAAETIEYLGHQSDVHACLKDAHAIVHASYHEGMSNVLLEAAACGRPVIATDVAGCRETYDDHVSGIACKARDGDDLVRAIREFIALPYDQKALMGQAGRRKVELEFDRSIIINRYMKTIEEIEFSR